jgi:hypothetical protein
LAKPKRNKQDENYALLLLAAGSLVSVALITTLATMNIDELVNENYI